MRKKYYRSNYTGSTRNSMPEYTRNVDQKDQYQALEQYIDELVDFAAEIREHEPTWKREKK